MNEVVPTATGWTWRMIGFDRRPLVYVADEYPCTFTAFAAAKAYRTAFWARACTVDHRMGACI